VAGGSTDMLEILGVWLIVSVIAGIAVGATIGRMGE
jgi:hypothetical protein